jgi:hypothetical protein
MAASLRRIRPSECVIPAAKVLPLPADIPKMKASGERQLGVFFQAEIE